MKYNLDRRKSLFIILMLGALETISPFAIDMYLPAFGQIAESFKTTPALVSLSVSSYFVGLAIGQVIYGPILDRFGRKKPLYIGMVIFILSSIACALSTSVEELVFWRFIQALGGCAAQVAVMAMVRDFFPVDQSAKVFSLLLLVLSVSPLLAPTFGSAVAIYLGWQAVFYILGGLVALMLVLVYFKLPEAHLPDKTISLRPKPIAQTFWAILKVPQFYTYSIAGAFSFAGLFVYVAGSPVIFMENFGLDAAEYGAVFALLATGFIGASQLNILLMKRYSSAQLFVAGVVVQTIVATIFMAGTYYNLFGLELIILFFFLCLACLGVTYPNAAALALAPFEKNAGSASALLGFLQIGLSAITSIGVGLLNTKEIFPIIVLLAVSTFLGLVVLLAGRRNIKQ